MSCFVRIFTSCRFRRQGEYISSALVISGASSFVRLRVYVVTRCDVRLRNDGRSSAFHAPSTSSGAATMTSAAAARAVLSSGTNSCFGWGDSVVDKVPFMPPSRKRPRSYDSLSPKTDTSDELPSTRVVRKYWHLVPGKPMLTSYLEPPAEIQVRTVGTMTDLERHPLQVVPPKHN